jgi:hypothetical protein
METIVKTILQALSIVMDSIQLRSGSEQIMLTLNRNTKAHQ